MGRSTEGITLQLPCCGEKENMYESKMDMCRKHGYKLGWTTDGKDEKDKKAGKQTLVSTMHGHGTLHV